MSLDIPSVQEIDGSGLRFAVIASRYNEALVDSLVHHACATLEAAGSEAPLVERVPGAAELPFAAATLAAHKRFNAILCIGVVIAGDTKHHEIIGDSTASALLDLSLTYQVKFLTLVFFKASKTLFVPKTLLLKYFFGYFCPSPITKLAAK